MLAWAAEEQRIVLTHDFATLIGFAYDRVRVGSSMPGVIAVPQSIPIATVVEDLVLVATCSESEEWRDQVRYLPLR